MSRSRCLNGYIWFLFVHTLGSINTEDFDSVRCAVCVRVCVCVCVYTFGKRTEQSLRSKPAAARLSIAAPRSSRSYPHNTLLVYGLGCLSVNRPVPYICLPCCLHLCDVFLFCPLFSLLFDPCPEFHPLLSPLPPRWRSVKRTNKSLI